jgi:F-type H+-transporting ATP synthase subunit e
LDFQVLRWSALGAGIFYGFYHQRQINKTLHSKAAEREYKHKQELIEKAKAEFAKSKAPAKAESKTGGRKSHSGVQGQSHDCPPGCSVAWTEG